MRPRCPASTSAREGATTTTEPRPLSGRAADGLGLLLFLFIPLVLFLFVRHPEPVGISLLLGVALMVGHRRLALPYLAAVRPTTCVWCHRRLGEVASEGPAALELVSGPQTLALRACPEHVEPTRRFFTFLDRARWPLRLGIALPLLALLATLAAAAAGAREALLPATELFRLAVGLTVHAAAAGGFFTTPAARARAAFPVHNFYLLGVRAILWIFRLVGVWWILAAGAYWLARLAG